MKREFCIIVLSCLVAFVLLWGVSVWQNAMQNRKKTPSAKKLAVKKPKVTTFQPYNVMSTTVVKTNNEVQINLPGNGGDPPWPELRILATVLQQDKHAISFVLTNPLVVLSSSSIRKMVYDRKKQTLALTVYGTMAGVGVTENNTTICRKISDKLLLNLVTKKPEATLWDLGGACAVVAPTKKQPRKKSKNFSKSP
jgi:hypothetical protein